MDNNKVLEAIQKEFGIIIFNYITDTDIEDLTEDQTIIWDWLKEQDEFKMDCALAKVPKYYSSWQALEELTQEERQALYKQCSAGRSCYLNDVETFFEYYFDKDGNVRKE